METELVFKQVDGWMDRNDLGAVIRLHEAISKIERAVKGATQLTFCSSNTRQEAVIEQIYNLVKAAGIFSQTFKSTREGKAVLRRIRQIRTALGRSEDDMKLLWIAATEYTPSLKRVIAKIKLQGPPIDRHLY